MHQTAVAETVKAMEGDVTATANMTQVVLSAAMLKSAPSGKPKLIRENPAGPSTLSTARVAGDVPSTSRSSLTPTEAMENRLTRLGYDHVNTARIMKSIENGERVVIVGENMKRVNALARMVDKADGKSVTYAPKNWNGMSRNSLEANRSWIRYWAKEKGTPTVDIGRQPTIRPSGPSPFYGIENRSLNKWNIFTPFSE